MNYRFNTENRPLDGVMLHFETAEFIAIILTVSEL